MDLEEASWYGANSDERTHPAAAKKANSWGLFDMLGNVAEWCGDTYQAEYPREESVDPVVRSERGAKVVRGGSWAASPAVAAALPVAARLPPTRKKKPASESLWKIAMNQSHLSRRKFVSSAASIAGYATLSAGFTGATEAGNRLHLASNEYSWTVFFTRENRNFKQSLDAGLAEVEQSGLNGFEPSFERPEEIDRIAPLLKKNGLQMRSFYINSTLHEPDKAGASIKQILAVARKAKPVGTRLVVTNPSPIRWAGPENKDDKQLRAQAAALEKLGRELNRLGLTLAYHNHDMELRNGAREFHHMMVGTDPALVSLCLDAHWIYRGTGNSSVALFDIVELYGSRVVEVHLRQSQSGIWSETFGDGDIDYPRLAARLKAKRVKPHLVLEVAVEKGTPKTLDPVAAHRRSVEYAQKVFAGL